MRMVLASCAPGEGAGLVRALVEERLAACGNVLPGVRAIYRWQGELCDEPEELLLLETSAAKAEALVARLAALHSYELPKILVLEPADALAAYRAWVGEEVG